MVFTLLERLMIPGLMPKEGNFVDNMAAENLVKDVRFESEELERARDPEGLNFRPNERGGMDWENEFAEDFTREVHLTLDQAALLKKVLTKMNDLETLPRDANTLYQKIVMDATVVSDETIASDFEVQKRTEASDEFQKKLAEAKSVEELSDQIQQMKDVIQVPDTDEE